MVRHDPELGNVLVATRPFRRGDRVLCERPLMVVTSPWDFKEMLKTVDQYTYDTVMEMCFPPTMGPKKKELKRDASSALTLGAILSSNGHAYSGSAENPQCHTALYHLGSKAQHSCAPNCAYRNVSGLLLYTALVDIDADSIVTFSYCLDWRELQLPTFARRMLISEKRGFDCVCARCSGPDLCRRVVCAACGLPRLLPDSPTVRSPESWSCQACGVRVSGKGAGLEEELKLSDTVLQFPPHRAKDVAWLKQLQATCREQLGPIHWTFAKCTYSLAIACADSGHDEERRDTLEHYGQYVEILREAGLERHIPSVLHVLSIYLCDSGAIPEDRVADLYKAVLPLYQAIHGPISIVERMVERLGGSGVAATFCRDCGFQPCWEPAKHASVSSSSSSRACCRAIMVTSVMVAVGVLLVPCLRRVMHRA